MWEPRDITCSLRSKRTLAILLFARVLMSCQRLQTVLYAAPVEKTESTIQSREVRLPVLADRSVRISIVMDISSRWASQATTRCNSALDSEFHACSFWPGIPTPNPSTTDLVTVSRSIYWM